MGTGQTPDYNTEIGKEGFVEKEGVSNEKRASRVEKRVPPTLKNHMAYISRKVIKCVLKPKTLSQTLMNGLNIRHGKTSKIARPMPAYRHAANKGSTFLIGHMV